MPVGVFPGFTSNAIWGAISGDITDQTDLQDALDAKQDAILSAVLSADFPKTNQTLANVTGLTLTLTAGHWYRVTGQFVSIADGSDAQFDFNGGAATATGISGGSFGYSVANNAVTANSYITALNTLIGISGLDDTEITFDFTIQVNAGGTLIPRYSQINMNASPSTLKKYSTIQAIDVTP